MAGISQFKFHLKIYFVLLILFIPFQAAHSDPFITIPPDTLDPYHQEVTLYAFTGATTVLNSYQAPVLQYDFSVLKNTEIDVYIPYQINTSAKLAYRNGLPNTKGIGDINVQLKYRFIQETDTRPQITFMPVLFFPTGNANQNLGNGKAWYQFPLGLQKSFGSWKAYSNIGYALNKGENGKNFFLGGVVLEKNVTDKLMLGAEVYSQTPSFSVIGSFTLLNFGGTYQYSKHWSSSAMIGHSIGGLKQWVAYIDIDWI